MISELKLDKIISCNFPESNIVNFCHFQKCSSHLLSQNSSPHARHVSLDGTSVNHTIKVLEPNRKAGIIRVFVNHKMLELLGFFVSQTVKTPDLLGFVTTCTVKMLEFLGIVVNQTAKMLELLGLLLRNQRSKVKRGSPCGQWPIATD